MLNSVGTLASWINKSRRSPHPPSINSEMNTEENYIVIWQDDLQYLIDPIQESQICLISKLLKGYRLQGIYFIKPQFNWSP